MNLRSRRAALLPIALLAMSASGFVLAQSPSSAEDKYLWLEDVSSDRSMGWVKAENARTAKVLEGDPRFAAYQAEAFELASASDRLALPSLRGGEIYNFWRDAQNPHGLLRKTSLADYLTANPAWHPVIDYDALGKQEKQSWVSKGQSCLYPGDEYCMMNLSAGGEDADTVREFDLKKQGFVEGGFVLPRSKGSVAWRDKDTLLLSRDWGGGHDDQVRLPVCSEGVEARDAAGLCDGGVSGQRDGRGGLLRVHAA